MQSQLLNFAQLVAYPPLTLVRKLATAKELAQSDLARELVIMWAFLSQKGEKSRLIVAFGP